MSRILQGVSYAFILALLGTVGCAGRQTTVRPEKPQASASVTKQSKSDGLPRIIADLERFLQRPDLNRSMRAQAMFRLAALHDEQGPGVEQRNAAIALYAELIRDFSDADVVAPSHYFLALDLAASLRLKEAQHVLRALVCRNHFAFIPPAESVAVFPVPPLPQEHDRSYWHEWELRHPIPLDKLPKKKSEPADEETVFINPFPPDCKALPVKTTPGHAPPYIGDAWWQMGDYHFAQLDPFSGPYNLNLAAVAFRNAIRHGNAIVRGVAMYKLGWTYFRQQRYAVAVEQFIDFLRYVDAHPQPQPPIVLVSDLRHETMQYVAMSLSFVDFVGPGPDDPFIPRDDVLDTERDPRIAEQKMHVAIDRVRDPRIIPQNEKWTSDIYEALISEFRELNQFRNMIETSEWFLSNWPNDARVPDIRRGIDQARARIGPASVP